MSPRRFHILTFGCQMNVYDSDRLSRLLRSRGWEEAADPEESALVFLNTCAVREKAAARVIARLRELRSLKKRNPSLILGLGGCVAEHEGARILETLPFLDLVVGPRRLPEVPLILEGDSPHGFPAVLLGDPGPAERLPESLVYPPPPAGRGIGRKAPVSAFVTVMEGCDNFCAYCVVPKTRGRERSRPREEVLKEARALTETGAVEIVLLGQNVNSYGRDSSRGDKEPNPFASLLRDLDALSGLLRLRFTTSHPKNFPGELIEAFRSLKTLCPHLHLPLQSGSDGILKAMGRGYGYQRYLETVRALRSARPDLALSADVICGFPGESAADFQLTLEAVREIRFDSLFAFRYSDRPGTRGAGMEGKVPEEEKARRLEALLKIQREISLSINRGLVGRVLKVLPEGPGREAGQLTGRSGGNKIVNFFGDPSLLGRETDVLITRAGPVSLLGELTPPPAQAGAL
ncbi:MAG: tRNA (N6-isopentenyl adenosine(37)-C2)-methylthiotransferase MiaB [Deltaproteobacteria bacterium]|jgi:tRNA-2-methylthio-N6-dimethylallyladenosine synthase|nr:tRNA (N6-isopentenyl adenosine(37)-C2)-methylthiotransferase MiaB [Deltaproteobacteria bacterium]